MLFLIIAIAVISAKAETIVLDDINDDNYYSFLKDTIVNFKCNGRNIYYDNQYCNTSMLCNTSFELDYCNNLECKSDYRYFPEIKQYALTIFNKIRIYRKRYNYLLNTYQCSPYSDLNFIMSINIDNIMKINHRLENEHSICQKKLLLSYFNERSCDNLYNILSIQYTICKEKLLTNNTNSDNNCQEISYNKTRCDNFEKSI